MDSRKRETSYEYDDTVSKMSRKEVGSDSPSSNHDNIRDEEFDPYDSSPSPLSLHSEAKSSEEFFPLAKQNEKKKRHYRGANEDYVQDNREKYRQHKKRRTDRERRDRHPHSSNVATDSVHTKDRGSSGDRVSGGSKRNVRYSPYGHRSKHSLEQQYRGRERDEGMRYNREDEEGYRRDEVGWVSREGRTGSSQERRRAWEESYSQGRGGRSSPQEELAQPARRHGREGWMRERTLEGDSRERERTRDERRFHQKRRMERRTHYPLDRSPVSGGRSPSASASSEDSGEDDQGVSRRKVELRQDNIESLIKDLEDVKESSGEISSDSNSNSSRHSGKESGAFGMRQEMVGNIGDIHREESESTTSGEDYSNDDGFTKNQPRPYSRSRSRSPELVGKYQELLPGQAMRSKFDSYDLSDGEEGELEEEKDLSSQLLGGVHSDQSDNEKNTTEDEQKKKEEEDSENQKLSAQFVKDLEDEEAESDGDFGDLPCYYPALMGCRNVECYEWLNRIEEGAYGVVHRGKDKRTGEIVALKKLKMEKEREGFPITSLREINMLLKAKHPNVVHVKEIVVGSNMDKIFIVMEYVEHDLKTLMDSMPEPFRPGEVKTLMAQLLSAVNHLHDNWILHRDLKASNLLLSHKGILKVGDFGLSREYGSPLKKYTPVVVTLWYRPPELLLGAKEYSTAVDMWSVGCLFAELIKKVPLFKGQSEIDQLNLIFKELGTPSERIWQGYSKLPTVEKVTFTQHPYNVLRKRFPTTVLTDNGFELLNRYLTYDPIKRITALVAMEHQYFKEPPMAIPPSMFPTWPAKSEMMKGKKRDKSPKPPSGGQNHFLGKEDKPGPGFNLKFN